MISWARRPSRSAASACRSRLRPPPRPRPQRMAARQPQRRNKDFGWCKGTIISKITDRRRRVGSDQVNFVAKFDMDQGRTTDLSLDATMYDTSPSAEYESWLLLEPHEE